MNIHYLQHVPFEGPACIEDWAIARGHRLTSTMLYDDGESLPEIERIDWLVVMGGPMNVYEEGEHAWLRREKRFIERALNCDKTVLGVCLGAQLVADVLGARVYRNGYEEIGWFPVEWTQEARRSPAFATLPLETNVFHWHGDTFDLPRGALHAARNEACRNQGFVYGEKVVGLQFHLEVTRESAGRMFRHCADEITGGKFVQNPSEILSDEGRFRRGNELLFTILDALELLADSPAADSSAANSSAADSVQRL
jgi:GMP synthase (glutamine-hydrolysing)